VEQRIVYLVWVVGVLPIDLHIYLNRKQLFVNKTIIDTTRNENA
jgi:hypothetical protein